MVAVPIVRSPHHRSPGVTVQVVWACAGRASAPESASSAAAARARAERTRPRRAPHRRAGSAGRPAADAHVEGEGEGPPPRQGGRRSGGAGGRRCSRCRGAVMASALGARRSALGARRSALGARRSALLIRRTASNHCAQCEPIVGPPLAPARSDNALPPAKPRAGARVARARWPVHESLHCGRCGGIRTGDARACQDCVRLTYWI